MSLCVWCYQCESTGAICGACLLRARSLLLEAEVLLPELDTEIALRGVKTRAGSGGVGSGGDSPVPVNLTAVQAKNELRAALKTIALRVKAPAILPAAILTYLYRAQNPYTGAAERDPLESGLPHLAEAVRAARYAVDIPAEKTVVGECECGRRIKTTPGADTMRCACGRTTPTTEARTRLGEHILDAMGESTLKISDTPLALAQCGYTVTTETVKSWVRHGKITATAGRVKFADVLDAAERRHIKQQQKKSA